ncbi:MAG TPA: sigma-70 family RNA polymerase sigma factor [Gemmatimonadaceae bacterium]|nr:sigma-70 family RNA polymerase sigma factor [Gemmatimonadaceae bacterium]
MRLISVDTAPSDSAADPLVDARLAARLRAGDQSALDELFRRHAGGLLRLAAGLVDTDAEDVVQDVFVGLSLALRGYEERGAFAAWLRGVTVRTALSRRRRSAHRRETALDPRLPRFDRRDPADGIALRDALRRLPDPLRQIFVLKLVEGYSHAEIASLLDIRTGTSEVRLFRAIRQLRSLLSDHR